MPEGYELPKNPGSRVEIYLDILCGSNRPLPPLPVLSRTEAYLRYLCENGGQGGGGSGVAKGYYYEGNFYEDAAHTKLITPEEGNLYYDQNGKILYIYKNGAYSEMGDTDVPVKDVQVDGVSVVDENGIANIILSGDGYYDSLTPVGDIDETYLAKAEYSKFNYDYAKTAIENIVPNAGACTAINANGYFIRNYDWKYSNDCEFVVISKGSRKDGLYASVGMVGNVPSLTKDFVKSGEYSKMYELLPFMLTDGKNEYGLVMSINVVPNDKGNTTGTLPGAEEINALMFIRWALDHCKSVDEVIAATQNDISIHVPDSLRDMGYEVHFLIADSNKSKVLEFINNECVWNDCELLTNFFIDGVSFTSEGFVPDIGDETIGDSGLTQHSQGLERYNLVNPMLVYFKTAPDYAILEMIFEMLEYTLFTNFYKDEDYPHYSELCDGDLTITSPIEDFQAAFEIEAAKFPTRSRDAADTWQSVHSVFYSSSDNKMYILTQERFYDIEEEIPMDPFIFDLPVAVEDVQVEGKSVVKNGVAHVNVGDYAYKFIEFAIDEDQIEPENLAPGGLFFREASE